MKRFQFTEYGGAIQESVQPLPDPQEDEVVLSVDACGVCHSDVHVWEGFFDLGGGKKLDVSASRDLPFTLGHEIAGNVVSIGNHVTEVAVGDRVVAFPWIGCGDCGFCHDGREHLCLKSKALGTHVDGGFADHVVVPHSRYLFPYGTVPTDLAGTYACSGLASYSALLKVEGHLENQLVIIGAGGLGLAALQLARAMYDVEYIVVDIDQSKLDAARKLGATHTINASESGSSRALRKLTGGGCTAILDFVGNEASATQGLRLVGKGGILVIVGLMGGTLQVALPLIPLKDITIRGSDLGSLDEMKDLMALVRDGEIEPIPIETRPLETAQQTLEDLRDGKIVGRVVLRP